MHILGDNSAFVNPVGQLLLTRRDKTRMDAVGIVGPYLNSIQPLFHGCSQLYPIRGIDVLLFIVIEHCTKFNVSHAQHFIVLT